MASAALSSLFSGPQLSQDPESPPRGDVLSQQLVVIAEDICPGDKARESRRLRSHPLARRLNPPPWVKSRTKPTAYPTDGWPLFWALGKLMSSAWIGGPGSVWPGGTDAADRLTP